MPREHPIYRYLRQRGKLREGKGLPHDILDVVFHAREQHLLHKRRLAAWMKESGTDVDRQEHLNSFDRASKEMHHTALQMAMNGLALVDGVMRANETLRVGLNMERAALDVNSVITMQNKVLKLRLLGLVAEKNGLDPSLVSLIIERAAAREFPVRDGPPPRDRSGAPEKAPLERALLAEARRISGERDRTPKSRQRQDERPDKTGRVPGVLYRPGFSRQEAPASSPFGIT